MKPRPPLGIWRPSGDPQRAPIPRLRDQPLENECGTQNNAANLAEHTARTKKSGNSSCTFRLTARAVHDSLSESAEAGGGKRARAPCSFGSGRCMKMLRQFPSFLRRGQGWLIGRLALAPTAPYPLRRAGQPLSWREGDSDAGSRNGCCPNLAVAPPSWRLQRRLEAGVTAQIGTVPKMGRNGENAKKMLK
jgi:hypothetical protein